MDINQTMERPLKIWEFVLGVIGIIITVSIMIYNRGTIDARNDLEINNLKIEMGSVKNQQSEQSQKVNEKLDRIVDKMTDIQVTLKGKQDIK